MINNYKEHKVQENGINSAFGPAIYQREEVCPMEIWVECFNKDKADFDKTESNAISLIMTQIPGWEKTGKSKVMGPYSKQRYYTRKK